MGASKALARAPAAIPFRVRTRRTRWQHLFARGRNEKCAPVDAAALVMAAFPGLGEILSSAKNGIGSCALLTSALPAGIAYPRKVLAVEDSTYDWWKLASTPCAMRPPGCEFPTPLAFRHQGCPYNGGPEDGPSIARRMRGTGIAPSLRKAS